jgi:hypothetical protein
LNSGETFVDIMGGLWLADYVGVFLMGGGTGTFFFHYMPAPLEASPAMRFEVIEEPAEPGEGPLFACPKLNRVALRVRVRPRNPNGIDVHLAAEVDYDPLRVKRVVLACEGAAGILGLNPSTLRGRIKKLGIRLKSRQISRAHRELPQRPPSLADN